MDTSLNSPETLNTCTFTLRRIPQDGAPPIIEAEVAHAVNGLGYAYRARAATAGLAIDKLAELHNGALGKNLGFHLAAFPVPPELAAERPTP